MRLGSFLTALCFFAIIVLGLQLVSPLGTAFLLEATVDVKPDALNVMRNGKWITVYISFPEGTYNGSDIDPSTILLENLFQPEWNNIEGDRLMLKFEASSVTDYLELKLEHMGLGRGPVDVLVGGSLRDGTEFEGTDTITVMIP